LTVLAEIPRDKYTFNTELLLYLAEAHQGNVSNLKKNFDQFLEKMPPRSSMRVLELFTAAADAARKSGDGQFAAILIRNAASTTADPAIKQLLARQLIAVSIDSAPDAAAQETIAYFRSYPNDKERMDLLMRTAAILYHRQAYRQAMDLYAFAIDNGGAAEAMTNAVGCAEQLKDFAALQKFNYQLFARYPDQIMHRMRYTAFLEENQKFDLAEKELLAAVSHAEKLPDTAAADKLQLLVMEFYRRHGNAERIRSAAEKLERSTDKNYVAAAKLELGELLEKSSGFMQAKKYFMDVEALAVKDLSPRASFKSALMSYRNYSFGRAAGEFFACAEKYPDYEKSAEALFMAYSLFDMQNDTVNAARADKMLREKYANCAAFAVLILDQAAKNNRNMPPEKLLADLESVEKNFPDSNFAAEARLLRGIFTAGTGKNKEALEILQELFTNRNRSVAAESLIRAGEILFSSGNFPEAGKYFTQSAAIDPGSRSSDIAALRAADCVLADKAPQNRQQLEKCIDSLTMLAEKSSFPAIRLEAAYKSAVAMQFAGMREKAAETFKTSIYRAADMYEKGVDINSAWCIKSCEAVLGMIQPGDRGGLAEGMKLLDVCRKILPDQDLSRMKQNFREKMSKKRR